MKIQSKLLDVINNSLNTQQKINARVTLGNLFSTPHWIERCQRD